MERTFEQSYRSVQSAVPSDSESSDSGSDEDACVWKRKSSKKRVFSPSPVKTSDAEPLPSTNGNLLCAVKKRKLNTVWCNVLQEQAVADDLVQFGLRSKPVSYQDRSCESYDFRLRTLDSRAQNESSTEYDSAPFKDTGDTTKLGEESSENSGQKNNSQRYWPKLVSESKDVVDKVAKKIIRVLNEPKHHIIYNVVNILGSRKALELLDETEKIEDNGGMLVLDNSRRRTPGGIFLQLVKKDTTVSNKKKSLIFAEDRKNPVKRKKRAKHSKKKKKNQLESMDIVCDPPVKNDGEDSVELNCNSNSSNETDADVQEVENGTEKNSEPEEGEITD